MTTFTTVDSPVGMLTLTGGARGLTGLRMHEPGVGTAAGPPQHRDDRAFSAIRSQLDLYFAGEPITFDADLDPAGTPFQLEVWHALREVPYGETISYGELARRIGNPAASRAVGLANGRNPIAIIVPCHRVIGADGSLTGYGGGLERKRFLLALEAGQAALL